ncbi:MAG: tRNA uridine-5-carboxymethylaminomethyl(34) synthesis enzyme MnmG [Chlamydiia bacterium]|nr:tRNA uridine-5-carboxymethylaminomethyl(34) synthesis enzyme MnmG [Chlamydiia bacterium]
MWKYPLRYEVIVVGGGHAGAEAAHAAAQMGCRTLLLTMNLDTIAKMSCNPAIGGIGKGHIVREIDALGGLMGKVADQTGIQFRMLNATKGPAVWAPRAQADKVAYQFEMKRRLEMTPNLDIKQGTIEDLLLEKGCVKAVVTKEGVLLETETVILSSGTFLKGLIHVGERQCEGGRFGDGASVSLSSCLQDLGMQMGRLKTGTPPRIHAGSIDYSLTEEQPGDEGIRFSYDPIVGERLPQISCHITYTSKETKQIIEQNLKRSPVYSGTIQSVGPRYCPSIEDKVVRFSDKEQHQIFLEPEGLHTKEVYVNGVSSALPIEVQHAFIRSIPALRNAEIMRPAYAIEYDYVKCGQIGPTLECRAIPGLFFAGQINGTTGYEEAAGQGLIAGINAANHVQKNGPFILKRHEGYIGVMIDDLITKELDEPYRMFTSRAEHRLLLRQDNADLRLRRYGFQLGLIDAARYRRLEEKERLIAETVDVLEKTFVQEGGKGYSLAQILCRPEMTYTKLQNAPIIDSEVALQVELNLKYAGYIKRQWGEVNKQDNLEKVKIPAPFDWEGVIGLRFEARQKLKNALPHNLGQAARLSGVSPADISVLLIALERRAREKETTHS